MRVLDAMAAEWARQMPYRDVVVGGPIVVIGMIDELCHFDVLPARSEILHSDNDNA